MNAALDELSLESQIFVELWDVKTPDDAGHDARSEYVERYWLPLLGPSTTWLLRYIATRLETAPSGLSLELCEVARALGLGERSGRNGPFMRSLARMIDFEFATMLRPGHLAIRQRMPSLSSRQLAHLSPELRTAHALNHERQQAPADPLRRRGVQLALSLLRLGESEDETLQQLLRWRYQPGFARSCVRSALAERASGHIQPA
jgi:hypothetical protein